MSLYKKYLFSGILIFLVVVLGLWFVFAAPVILPQDIYVNESVQYTYNISVNNTDSGATANITQVNITIPINFTFTTDTNGTDTIFETFTNTSTDINTTLIWTNSTVFLINGSGGPAGEKKYFWFNATATPGLYNITVTTLNATATYPWQIPVLVNDTTYPLISYGEGTEDNNVTKSQNWVYVNVSVTELFPNIIIFLVWNSTGEVNFTNYTMADQTSNTTINWTGLADSLYSYNVTVVDSWGNENGTATRNITLLDTTVPTISLSESSSTRATITVSFSCSDVSGVSSCSLSSSSGTVSGSTISGLNCGTSYTVTVTAEDYAGNTASSSQSFSTINCGGGGPIIPSLPKRIHSWTLITPGVAAIMKDFSSEFGVKQIRVRVRNEVQNVKITVTKHDGKPAEVSVEKSGKVYQYLQIGAENFDNTLEQATVEFRAERSWAAGVELGKNDIAVFRYNEAASRWDELTITSTGEDATYYYYEVELDEFSYFAIGEKSVVGEEEEEEEGGISVWVWILVAAVIIAIVVWQMKIKKK